MKKVNILKAILILKKILTAIIAKHLVGFGIFRRIIYLTVLGAFYLAFEFSYKFYILSVVIDSKDGKRTMTTRNEIVK